MNLISKIAPLLVLILIITCHRIFAQYKTTGYDVGISIGALVYQGDLTPNYLGYLKGLKPAITLNAGKSFWQSFAMRANLTYGKIAADESTYSDPYWRQLRNFKFSSSVLELTGTLIWNILGNNTYSRLSPYLFAGTGFSLLHIRRDWSNTNIDFFGKGSEVETGLAVDTLHSVPAIIPVVPLGAGVNYALSPKFSLNAETTLRLTGTDYVDGFKYAAGAKKRDSYYGVSVGVRYNLGKYSNIFRCPRF